MPTTPDDEVTRAPHASGATTSGPAGATPTPTRFAPGAIVARRYRLVGLLGRGGMGEVYRADDLTLDHPVALKFLPESVAADEARLSQFHNELRIARQVSHKNVCRMYDLGEADGRRFLTMEYVDGEDLASLLRRIGRIPQDKAVEIARQLCAGVAAAHDRGVLHRDLKPANVMIDGDGNVRITDFGIATAGTDTQRDLLGTPQYMAPELFEGRAASVKSDIHALGLILFEVFTGRRAIDSKTVGELTAFHRSGTITTPSSIVPDLDPAVERVILRCLERDPDRRPASALAVAAALPGADPLAAVLAAGETPSPEILAAAGEVEALGVLPSVALVAISVLGLLAFATLSARTSIVGRVPLDLPPAVLVDRAEQVIASLGYPSQHGDSAYGFRRAFDYLEWLFVTRLTPNRYDPIASGNPSAVLFWYRTTPRSLQPIEEFYVTLEDPPSAQTDMRTVVLDGRGRLRGFRSVPPQRDEVSVDVVAPRWERAFEAAGLEMSAFSAVPPEWTPRDFADVRAAWEGPLSPTDSLRVRIEASAYRGRLVSFAIVGPWTRPTLMQATERYWIDRVIIACLTVIFAALLVISIVIARRNRRANRADRQGAWRVAVFSGGVGLLAWALHAHHSTELLAEYHAFLKAASELVFFAAVLWAMYVALEPYVRRLWPDSLLGWSRLLAGHLRDPRVGRDVLMGLAVGVTLCLIELAKATIIPWLGYSAPSPLYGLDVEAFNGTGMMAVMWLLSASGAIQAALILLLLIVLVRLTLRTPWLTIPVTVFILSVPEAPQIGTTNAWFGFVFPIVSGMLVTWLVFRSGLLALRWRGLSGSWRATCR
jgi:predicted Ser/Thr protein kinase